MEVKPLQFSKQRYPNEVTEEGMVMEDKPLQPEKQDSPNEVTVEGIFFSLSFLYFADFRPVGLGG